VLRFLLLLVLGVFSISIVGAQDTTSSWTLTDVQPLAQLVGEDYEPTPFVFLAPDGSALAWQGENDGLSVYSFADQETTLYPWPENFIRLGRYSAPSWSPDGQYLAFTESLFDNLLESDLWLLDRDTGEITNRTDDGLLGGWLDFEEPFALDYLSTWNPATNDLYFLRSTQLEDGYSAELYLLPIERDEPKLVADLTNNVPVLSIYRPAAISPDGTRLAFIVLGSDLENPLNGVWLLDLKTGIPEQITSVTDLRSGLPFWQAEQSGLFPNVLLWAGNDALVVQSLDSQYNTGISQMAHYVDLASQQVTPITTFDDVTEMSELYTSDDPASPILRIPRAGVVTPDGGTFLFLRHDVDRNYVGISAVSLPPDGSAPVEIGDIKDFNIGPEAAMLPSMSADGKALMHGYLFQFEPAS
jgi:hypothetical protein